MRGVNAPLMNVSLRSLSLSSHLAGLINPSILLSFLVDLISLISLSRRSRGVRLSRAGVILVGSTADSSSETWEGEVRSHEVVYSSDSSGSRWVSGSVGRRVYGAQSLAESAIGSGRREERTRAR